MAERVIVGDLSVNCWIIPLDEKSSKKNLFPCIIIDPGADASLIIARLETLNLYPRHILLTHSHFDHIGAVPDLMDFFGEFSPELAVHHEDAHRLGPDAMPAHLADFSSVWGNSYVKSLWKIMPAPTRLLKEADEIGPLRVLHTPGHTPGSVCFYNQAEARLFSGDTLFAGGIGRTDLPGGDWSAMEKSLTRLSLIEGNTRVFPGHGPDTTIGTEFGEF